MTEEKRVHGLFAFYRGKEGQVPRVIASAVDTSGFSWTKRPWASEGTLIIFFANLKYFQINSISIELLQMIV
jgi:hypothetical protein